MAGQDQSVNLGGMLTDIGKTMGSMGDAYKPVLQAATKPRGDMSDPAHLQNLAQWASSNGDTAAASMYMSQAREAKAEQKEAKNVQYNADTYAIASDGTARAGEGDVTNLDRNIAMLQERVANATSTQQQAQAQRALEGAQASRKGALGVQTQNHAKAVNAIDAQLDSGVDANGNPVDPRALGAIRGRKEELLKDPEVQKEINAQKLEAFRAEQAQDAMEEKAYLDKNMPELREAVSDPKRADEIIASAPPSAQDALRQTYNSMRTFQEGIDNQTRLFDDVKIATNMDLVTIQVNQIPEELRAGPLATAEALRRAELGRDSEGDPRTTGHATAIKNAREAHTKALNAVSNAIGQQEYARRRGAEVRLETEVEDLNNQRETFRPSDDAIRTRARMLAEENEDYVKIGEDKRGKGGRTELNIGDYMQVATSQLRTEHRNDIDKQIALKTGEEIPEVETPDVEGWTNPKGQTMTQAVVDRGLEKVGKKKFVETLTDEGYTVEQITEMLGESPYPADVPKEPKMYRREPGLPRDIFGIEDRYNRNIAKQRERMTPQ